MMKKLFNTFSLSTTVAVAAVFMLMPLGAQASVLNICEQLPSLRLQVTRAVDSTSSSYVKDANERKASFADQQLAEAAESKQALTATSLAVDAYAENLLKGITTEKEKQAVRLFVPQIEKALAVQFAGETQVAATYATGVEDAIEDRKASVQTQALAMKKAMIGALDEASLRCKNGEVAVSVRLDLKAKMTSYQNTYFSAMNNKTEYAQALMQITYDRDTKKAALQSAFKADVLKAFQNLQSVLR